jgi:phospholipid/cholesterol/gamma-HCH transport system substrate-binding protein
MSSFLTPFRVGLVVLGGIAAFIVLLSFVGRSKYSERDTYRVFANFKDATGLGPKSRVQIAGIEVGEVEEITLTPDARANVKLRIAKNVPLHRDARITKRSASLLGDFLLDIYPGTQEQPVLKDGDTIGKVVSTPGMEDVFATLGEVTRDIQAVTQSLRSLIDSTEEGSIRDVIRSMNAVALGLNNTIQKAGGRLDTILADVQRLASTVRFLASGQEQNVKDIVGNIRLFTEQANRVLASINQIIGTGQGQLTESVAGVKDTLFELQKTLRGAEEMIASAKSAVDTTRDVVQRVDRGEGTLGKLLRDDGIAVKLDRTLSDVNALIAPVSELQLQVQMREELHWRPNLPPGNNSPTGKAVLRVNLAPRPDKFYGFELLSDPRGTVHTDTILRTNEQTNTVTTNEQVTVTNDVYKFSAFFGKRFGPAALRVGLIESTGGIGADAYALNDKFRFTVDAFDWSNTVARFPRVRVNANVNFLDHIFVGFGLDDILNTPPFVNGKVALQAGRMTTGIDGYIQGGIQFTDDDLKSLLAITGAPSAPR